MRMSVKLLPVRLLLLGAVVLWGLQALALEREQKLQLPMSDGATLATDIYLPKDGDGPWPAILVRSTYGRTYPVENLISSEWVRRDYALVVQDVRGTFISSREHELFYADGWRDDLHDGRDTAEWIVSQPWSNGKIGVTGQSGIGMPAYLIGPATPLVAAQYIIKSPPSFYHHAVFHGGVFRQDLVANWLTVMGRADMVEKYWGQPLYNDYWKPYDTIAQVSNTTAAGFFVGSWYDIFQQGIIDAFTAREYAPDSASKGKNYLVMQPATHNKPLGKDYKFRTKKDDAAAPGGDLRRKFFDWTLRGNETAMEGVPKVHFFVLGADTPADAPGNEWRSAERWPPYDTREAAFFLGPDKSLREGKSAEGVATFAADPNDPYPTWGGAGLSYSPPYGPYDQRRYSETRKDYVAFSTAPLEHPLEVTGRVRARLYVSTDARDTDFTAKLVDIYPDGREINVLDGIVRLKYRSGGDAPDGYTPGEVVMVEIDLWSISIIFAQSHRIGLHIAGSNSPRFAVNPNTGAERMEQGQPTVIAHNTIHFGPQHPSALLLPVHEE
jgi:predicted acyl esterase